MNLANDSWYVRWFFFVQETLFKDWSGQYRSGTTLCHFMRVTMLWGPLFVTFLVFCLFCAIVALFIAPYMAGGWLGVLGLWAAIAAVGATSYGLILFVGWLHRRAQREDSFARLTIEHAAAIKNRVCPRIFFGPER
jgi:hypothetical protein